MQASDQIFKVLLGGKAQKQVVDRLHAGGQQIPDGQIALKQGNIAFQEFLDLRRVQQSGKTVSNDTEGIPRRCNSGIGRISNLNPSLCQQADQLLTLGICQNDAGKLASKGNAR